MTWEWEKYISSCCLTPAWDRWKDVTGFRDTVTVNSAVNITHQVGSMDKRDSFMAL